MLMCCDDDIIDLGCWQSCDSIKTLIEIEYEGYFRISYNFNGAIINRRFKGTKDNGKLVLPAGLFNEDYVTRFELFDDEMTKIGCYKVKIYPTQEYVQKSIIPNISIQNYSCVGGGITFQLDFEFDDINDMYKVFKNGSFFRFSFIANDGTQEAGTLTNLSSGLIDSGGIEIDDILLVPNPFSCDVELVGNISGVCPTTLAFQLDSFSNMNENTIFNIPTQIIYD